MIILRLQWSELSFAEIRYAVVTAIQSLAMTSLLLLGALALGCGGPTAPPECPAGMVATPMYVADHGDITVCLQKKQ